MTELRIEDIPDDLYAKLAARAAGAGQTLEDHLRDELTRIAATPTAEEFEEMAYAKFGRPGEADLEVPEDEIGA